MLWPRLSSTDEEILDQFSSGSYRHRVLELYEKLQEPIYRYLLCLKCQPSMAEDLVHETFLRLHQHLQKSKDKDENIRAWTFRVAHNLAISLKRRTTELQVDMDTLIFLADMKCADEQSNPEENALKEEWLLNVRRTVETLPAQQQRCLHLRAEGLRYREISEVLGIPVSTVAIHLQRAVTRLMEVCGEP